MQGSQANESEQKHEVGRKGSHVVWEFPHGRGSPCGRGDPRVVVGSPLTNGIIDSVHIHCRIHYSPDGEGANPKGWHQLIIIIWQNSMSPDIC